MWGASVATVARPLLRPESGCGGSWPAEHRSENDEHSGDEHHSGISSSLAVFGAPLSASDSRNDFRVESEKANFEI